MGFMIDHEQFVYEITPTDLLTLPDEQQKTKLKNFLQMLSTLQNKTRIVSIKKPYEIEVGEENRYLEQVHTYVMNKDPLNQALSKFRYSFSDKIDWGIKTEKTNHLEFNDGSVGQCLTLYTIPGSLSPAWINSLLNHCDSVSVKLKSVRNDKAVGKLKKIISFTPANAPTEQIIKNDKARTVLEALGKQETKLFECVTNVLIKAKTLVELKAKVKEFKINTYGMMTLFEAVPTRQKDMLERGWGKTLSFELGSMQIFYPFVSSDMLETPNGVVIGNNMITGAPVVYDYTNRPNSNILIIGSSGRGKSVTSKTFLTRLLEMYPDAMAFMVDPKGEYAEIADKWKLEVVDADKMDGGGYDPFRIFNKKTDAADITADICDVGNTDIPIRNEMIAQAENCNSVYELYEKVNEKSKEYLKSLMTDDMKNIMEGDRKIGNRTVISLEGKSRNAISTLTVLAFAKIWHTILQLPKEQPKIVIVDEAWRLFHKENSARVVSEIGRLGRAYNVIAVFITQEVDDITTNDVGRTFANNAATKFILGLEPQAAKQIQKALDISPEETELLQDYEKGQALLLTKDYRLRIQVKPTKEEMELFSTTAAPTIGVNQ